MMGRLINLLLTFGVCLFVFTSCNEKTLFEDGEGTLILKVKLQQELPIVITRGSLTDEELLQRCKVYLRNKDGLVRKFASLAEVPQQIQLTADSYKAEVTAGDSVSASFENSYFKGVSEFVLSSGQNLSQSVVCKIQNLVTAIDVEEDLAEAMTDYSIILNTTKGKLVYTAKNISELGYFMLSGDENQLSWTFDGKMQDGTSITTSGVINRVKKATKYLLTFSNPNIDVGGGLIQVSVIEKNLDTADGELSVELNARPIIQLSQDGVSWMELDAPLYCALGDYSTPLAIGVASNAVLTSVQISSADFRKLNSGFPDIPTYDFVVMEDKERENLKNLGLSFSYLDDSKKKAVILLNEDLRRRMMSEVNSYQYDLQVLDANGRGRAKTLVVVATNISVATEKNKTGDAWSRKATLRGRILDPSKVTKLKFQYSRRENDQWTDWLNIPEEVELPSVGNTEFTYILRNLTPTTEYRYRAMDGDVASPIVYSFTTEAEPQLPNGDFEKWSGSLPMLICENESSMFWDSGNHGSKTGKVDITVFDTSIKNSGEKSIKMMSQEVGAVGVVQFAAGNVFVGKYLDTYMQSLVRGNGILGWGRPFGSRPIKLHGYVRYISGKVNYPASGKINKDDNDIGVIYIALGDWVGESYNGQSWPKIIKTNYENPSQALVFNPQDAAVIAYGAKEFNTSTSGEGLIEFTIPIDYRTESRVPTSIILVASASKFGDYFAGSTSSVMWLDDLELIYDK